MDPEPQSSSSADGEQVPVSTAGPPADVQLLPSDLPISPPPPRRGKYGVTLPSLMLSCAGLVLVAAGYFMSAAARARLPEIEKIKLTPELLKKFMHNNVPALLFSAAANILLIIGLLAAVVTVLVAIFDRRLRGPITTFFFSMSASVRPALGLFDTLALFCFREGAMTALLMFILLLVRISTPGEGNALAAIVSDSCWAIVVVIAIALARWKAHGTTEGTLGFWPFWKSPGVPEQKPLWHDIVLGVATYPIALWVIIGSNYLNLLFVKEPDYHPLLGILASRPRPLEIAVLLTAATVGAAVFEEIVFRGILYNALRRHMRGVAAAIVGALIFSAMHMIKANVLGLFALGLIMTWLYEKTGRLVAGMAFHFTNNFASTVYFLALFNNVGPDGSPR